MGRHEDEYEDGEYDDEYDDDEYDDDEYDDDEYDDEPPRGAGAQRPTLGDPMAGGGNFVKRRREEHQLRVPPRRQAPGAAAGGGPTARAPGGSVDALARIREQREQENFRKGFMYGAGIVGGLCALAVAVVVMTDGGHARRLDMAQIELARVQELAEDGDLEPGELRRVEIMALIAGPADSDEQLELARQHHATGKISDAELAWVQRAADMVGEGLINAKILKATTGEMRAVFAASADTGPDVFSKDAKTTITKEEARVMQNEDLDGRDLGLGKLARTQRQNRKVMKTANRVGKSMLEAAGKDPGSVDVQGAIEAKGIK